MQFTRNLLFTLLGLLLLQGCASSKKSRVIKKNIGLRLNSSFFENSFTGVILFDPLTKDTIFQHNSNKYFTPASNTKIFTLYASLKLLPDSIPSLKYLVKNDTIYAEGTGDPSLLHSSYNDSSSIKFLKQYKNIAFHFNNYEEEKYGPGWAWEDYDLYFSPERNSFPIYGNVVTIFKNDSLHVIPSYFRNKVGELKQPKNRKAFNNSFFFEPSREDTLEVPFIIDSLHTKELLEEVLQKKVSVINRMPEGGKKTLYSISSDSLYKRMMHQSDNFIAEQLLVLGSSTLSDTLTSSKSIEHILENELLNLKQQPRWVDGSGLSRYNLFTPESILDILNQLYSNVPKERLYSIFPSGGDEGTMKDWYNGIHGPYIYAKSGSLGNNYCLSGYLLTNSGKTLIFSFMNNHFRKPTTEVKIRMQSIFEHIRDTY
ncbi:D-alanyl-D-alanine carboxypeptidase/D-alanyl-D-alanine-endopeptidase (penicillin-binding protein 4) [Saonia flava]|uniref:D-alanyl-D-alanine carboxypeptidase/D-alanyl-D-alanine-endopeptidase (Penicillin-binding protein 4) n=1 Tax=Saonia flava TaxID=523696 RepID=A0A846QZM8_9FLAO|nr:D-alanyl-D-alanine carboxypeptidase [Saonia flava]NJB72112.1 D-alanyl-D-alanine carboxypeptidase/D-alanyl-D-alanine-endopeptidase (penicillin-binding protein 4) [Saonia flava]